jgi:hypothetical protein
MLFKLKNVQVAILVIFYAAHVNLCAASHHVHGNPQRTHAHYHSATQTCPKPESLRPRPGQTLPMQSRDPCALALCQFRVRQFASICTICGMDGCTGVRGIVWVHARSTRHMLRGRATGETVINRESGAFARAQWRLVWILSRQTMCIVTSMVELYCQLIPGRIEVDSGVDLYVHVRTTSPLCAPVKRNLPETRCSALATDQCMLCGNGDALNPMVLCSCA